MAPGVKQAKGVELYETRTRAGLAAVGVVMEQIPELLEVLAERIEIQNIGVESMDSWEGITHVYMYDLGFKRDCYYNMLRLWNESSTTRWMVSFRTPDLLWRRGFNLKLLCAPFVRQPGSSFGHRCYIYEKI